MDRLIFVIDGCVLGNFDGDGAVGIEGDVIEMSGAGEIINGSGAVEEINLIVGV